MLRLLIDRILFSVATLLGVGLCLFVLTCSIAGSPANIVLGIEATPDQILQFNHDHGLDRPVLVQYLDWIKGIVVHFDFGTSLLTGQPVGPIVLAGLPITSEIVGLAFIFAVVVALPLGILSATLRGSAVDHLARIVAVLGVSVPGFWIGLMLIRYPAVEFGWFPPGGYTPISEGVWPHLRSIILPAFALGIYYIAILSRMTRSGLVDVSARDYMRTARALGLGRYRMLVY
jgi:peptide/nickel transport system permease protein